MKIKTIIYYITIALLVVVICLLGYNIYEAKSNVFDRPVVTMEVEDYGTIEFELYPEYAPIAAANFVTLANNGFYDGLKFHRVVKDFMIQAGDKQGTGSGSVTYSDLLKDDAGDKGSKAYTIKGEFKNNGVNNPINFEEGVVAMARADYTTQNPELITESYDSAGSQFFIMSKTNLGLNGEYAPFGKVTKGMEVVHEIENVEVKASDDENAQQSGNTEASIPVKDVIIKSVTVDTKGVDYKAPDVNDAFDYSKYMYNYYGVDPQQMATTSMSE